MNNTLKITLFSMMFVFAICVSAQEKRTIGGTVTDQRTKETIIGATVMVVGTNEGTVSDIDGKFELSVEDGAVLKISSFGYQDAQEKVVAGKSVYNIALKEESNTELDEVVAVGYGHQKRSDLTGSITTVRVGDVKDFSSKSLAESLGGMAAGVMVTKGSGSPGEEAEIMIRGLGSVNGMKPLYIVDGIRQEANFSFNMRDVESIEILKDAGSAAIYGAQAAGGVILITTKKGGGTGDDNKTTAQVTANARFGVRNIYTGIKLLDRNEYVRAKGFSSATGQEGVLAGLGVTDINELPNVNWMKVMFGTGIEQEYNLAVAGGNSKTKFYLSASYYDEKGTFLDTRASRLSFRNNLEYKFNKYVTIGESIYGTMRNTNPSRPCDYVNAIPFLAMPTMEPLDKDGNWTKLPGGHAQPNLYANELVYHANRDVSYSLNGQIFLNITFIDGLDLRASAAAEVYGYAKNIFTEKYDFGAVKNAVSYMEARSGTHTNLTLNATLTYDTKQLLKNHNLKIMIGTEWIKYDEYGLGLRANNFNIPFAESIRLATGDFTGPSGGGKPEDYPWEGRTESFFGRLNYSYAGKYLLTANIRIDYSDKFGIGNKFGVFPSVNAGWRLSEEKFIKNNATWLNNAKIRASYGILGNDRIPAFRYLYYYYLDQIKTLIGNELVTGAKVNNHANAKIRWEEVRQLDLGIDLAFLRSRLTFTYDYYNRQTYGMLYERQVPLTSGVGWFFGSKIDDVMVGIMYNAGRMQNTGHEFSIGWNDKTKFGLKYAINVNASFNRNKMLTIGEYIGEAPPYDEELLGWGQPVTRTADGNPVSLFYGYEVIGIFESAEQVAQYNQDASDKTGGLFSHYQEERTGAGDLIYRDVNGNGYIDAGDRTFIGNPWPKAIIGLNFIFEYKGFDLSMNFQSALGFDIFNSIKAYTQNFRGENTTAEYFNASFLGENGLTEQPRVGYWATLPSGREFYYGDDACNKNYSRVSSYFVEKGDYLKLKNLVFGYTLPQKVLKKMKMQQFRVYLSAQNLFTITKYTGIDPEIGEYKNPITGSKSTMLRGVDTYNRYLPSRLFSFGIDLTF